MTYHLFSFSLDDILFDTYDTLQGSMCVSLINNRPIDLDLSLLG